MDPNDAPHPLSSPGPAAGELLDEDLVHDWIDWPGLFGPEAGPGARVEVEVGCGNGRYLRRAARERPGSFFLGIERSAKYARMARDRMVKNHVARARVCRADATRFLASRVPAGSVDALHVYFTDPWPKTRHAKRRLFQAPFLETAHRILRPGARVFVKVDLFWYFEEIMGRFERSPLFCVVANGTERDRGLGTQETTGFEDKALRKKGAVFFMEAERLA